MAGVQFAHQIEGMPSPPVERRGLADLRTSEERRRGVDRRVGERRQVLTLVPAERRGGRDRRQGGERRGREERRSGTERRGPETAAAHIRNAVALIAHVAESDELDDERRRDLDAAIFRLRFALDRLEGGD